MALRFNAISGVVFSWLLRCLFALLPKTGFQNPAHSRQAGTPYAELFRHLLSWKTLTETRDLTLIQFGIYYLILFFIVAFWDSF